MKKHLIKGLFEFPVKLSTLTKEKPYKHKRVSTLSNEITNIKQNIFKKFNETLAILIKRLAAY